MNFVSMYHMQGGKIIAIAPPLSPPPTLPAAEIASKISQQDQRHNDAPDTLAGQVDHMRRWGYVRIKSFVAPETLVDLQFQFRNEQAAVMQVRIGILHF